MIDPNTFPTALIFFLLGLLIGSFLNALEYRLFSKQSIIFTGKAAARSQCPNCRHTLTAQDLIPVISYLTLNGKCRYCSKPISRQYPTIELATAGVCALVALTYGPTIQAVIIALFGCILTFIFLYDYKHQLIPDSVTFPSIVFAFALSWGVLGTKPQHLLLGACIAGGFFAFQYIISRGKWIGGGDIRLGVLMGCMLGWQYTLAALVLAYVVGALIGVYMIATKRMQMDTRIPFGTFLAAATFVCLLFGDSIVYWYIQLLV